METIYTMSHVWDKDFASAVECHEVRCDGIKLGSALLKFVKPPAWGPNEIHHSRYTGWIITHTGPDSRGNVPVTKLWMRPLLHQP